MYGRSLAPGNLAVITAKLQVITSGILGFPEKLEATKLEAPRSVFAFAPKPADAAHILGVFQDDTPAVVNISLGAASRGSGGHFSTGRSFSSVVLFTNREWPAGRCREMTLW
jgi:hypothetical protein